VRTALVNGRILSGERIVSGQTVLISAGRIEDVVLTDDRRCRDAVNVDLQGQILLPGFIDVQVNGGGGVLFNDDPSLESIRAIGSAHRRFGTTGFLPTLISDDLDTIGQAIAAVQASLDAHLPLAPEMTTTGMIAQLAANGILVSAGHSDANFAQTSAAIAHGVRGFTHLFNAMAPLAPREPGIVGAALFDANTWCGIIVDGHHVDPVMLKLALRCKRHDKFMLVTDAMPPVGSPEPSFVLQGRTIHVKDGVCRDENGTLAGTGLDMATAVRNAVSLLDLEIAEAARMASEYPAAFLGLDGELGRIAPGYRANLALLDDDLQVRRTWIEGITS
jgi:N-acetylglucosamine-6-phosphate deacetylase